jgi:hypothetical protein
MPIYNQLRVLLPKRLGDMAVPANRLILLKDVRKVLRLKAIPFHGLPIRAY